MASVTLRGIEKRFGKTDVVSGVDLVIPANQLTVLVGPSGCGKSTLLRLIAGLERPDRGKIYLGEECVNEVPPFQRGVGMVFQSYALYPHMTVYENLCFGLTSLKLSPQEVRARIEEAVAMLDLKPYLDRKPRALSGGQRQRVAMGRAIVRQPRVFLLDEPLSNLDAQLRVKMRVEIARLRERLNATMLYVTHDQVEAMTLAHKLVVMREGEIEQEGPPLEVYERPRRKFVAGFLGSPAMNFISGTCEAVARALGRKADGNVEFGIRPEHLSVGQATPYPLHGNIHAIEHLGDVTLVHVALKGEPTVVVARAPAGFKEGIGSLVQLGFEPRHCHVFAAKT